MPAKPPSSCHLCGMAVRGKTEMSRSHGPVTHHITRQRQLLPYGTVSGLEIRLNFQLAWRRRCVLQRARHPRGTAEALCRHRLPRRQVLPQPRGAHCHYHPDNGPPHPDAVVAIGLPHTAGNIYLRHLLVPGRRRR